MVLLTRLLCLDRFSKLVDDQGVDREVFAGRLLGDTLVHVFRNPDYTGHSFAFQPVLPRGQTDGIRLVYANWTL